MLFCDVLKFLKRKMKAQHELIYLIKEQKGNSLIIMLWYNKATIIIFLDGVKLIVYYINNYYARGVHFTVLLDFEYIWCIVCLCRVLVLI